MARKKRNPDQRAQDLEWLVVQADEGLGPNAILRRAHEPVPDDFGTPAEIKAEQARRKSVSRVSNRQVGFDLRQVRRRAIEGAENKYRKILDRTLEELSRLGFADLRSVCEWGPDGYELLDSMELPEAEAAIVSGITWKKTTRTTKDENGREVTETTYEGKLDTHSKTSALRDLLRHLGGYLQIQMPVDSADAEDVIDQLIKRLGEPEILDPGGSDEGAPGAEETRAS